MKRQEQMFLNISIIFALKITVASMFMFSRQILTTLPYGSTQMQSHCQYQQLEAPFHDFL